MACTKSPVLTAHARETVGAYLPARYDIFKARVPALLPNPSGARSSAFESRRHFPRTSARELPLSICFLDLGRNYLPFALACMNEALQYDMIKIFKLSWLRGYGCS
jgi:hypothetical protein